MNAHLLALALLLPAVPAQKPPSPPPTLKSVLLDQLKSTHNQQDWFVPASKSVAGLTAEQANWKQGDANHSIAQLVQHLVFWNRAQLAKMKREKGPAYSGDNKETFAGPLDKAAWEKAAADLDAVLSDMEKWIEVADDQTLQKWYDTIAHISAHNAYHTGQILYIRKQQGSWDPEKGVKG
ncbi:MAG TPA: DinB family protein [Thermoanaerobaculia bacterium]|jgi:uncharacterized damage-inducible protein DinB